MFAVLLLTLLLVNIELNVFKCMQVVWKIRNPGS